MLHSGQVFREGRASVKDDPRSGRPLTATTKENIKRVEELVEEDRRISIRAIEAITSLNIFAIHGILHDHRLEVRRDRFEAKTLFCIFFRSTGTIQIKYIDKGVRP